MHINEFQPNGMLFRLLYFKTMIHVLWNFHLLWKNYGTMEKTINITMKKSYGTIPRTIEFQFKKEETS